MRLAIGWKAKAATFAALVGTLLAPEIGQADNSPIGQTEDSSIEPAAQRFFPAPEDGVEGRYNVTLFAVPAASAAAELARSADGRLLYVYREVLNGFRIDMDEERAEELSRHPWVKGVYQETYIREPISELQFCYDEIVTETNPTDPDDFPDLPVGGVPVDQDVDCDDPAPGEQCSGNWGLDRTDQLLLPRDEFYSYRQAASSVKVYTIDTGVAFENIEFLAQDQESTRVLDGLEMCDDYPSCPLGNSACVNDGDDWLGKGHGTHVAGIIAGRSFGLAKDASIFPIKALCAGEHELGSFVLALEHVGATHSTSLPTAVVNISGLNGNCGTPNPCASNPLLREAIVNLASRNNILIVQSAGNQSANGNIADACSRSFGNEASYTDPGDIAAISRILVAAGSDENDALWWSETGEFPPGTIGSNAGPCVDIFAPAAHIASSFFPVEPGASDPNEIACQLSGTSMATPHVSGVAAMILSEFPDLDLSSAALRTLIVNWGTRGVMQGGIGTGTPNNLLHWNPINLLKDGFDTGDTRLWIVSP